MGRVELKVCPGRHPISGWADTSTTPLSGAIAAEKWLGLVFPIGPYRL
jgi:hypothetical protein